jgi:phosphoglycerate kinase
MFKTLDDVDVTHKRVLVRVDLNVPMEAGKVTDLTRLDRIAVNILELSRRNAKVILLAHFGRPKGVDETQSLLHVLPSLSQVLGKPVKFADDCIGEKASAAINAMKDGEILLLENTRFYKEEEKNDAAFVKALAANGDIWVNDAFSVSHRAHATTEGLGHILPAYVGRTMQAEIEALANALEVPKKPVAAVVGGAKVPTKLELLGNLSKKVDYLIIGGGMANTFLAAQGYKVGKSLCEHDLLETARSIIIEAKNNGCTIVLPQDVVVAREFKSGGWNRTAELDDVKEDEMILDMGSKSIQAVNTLLDTIKTLVWNGPFGAFELFPYNKGTNAVAKYAGRLTNNDKLLSVAGGGDTVAALNASGAGDDFTYVSTAGGAFLEWLEGKALPGVEILRKR